MKVIRGSNFSRNGTLLNVDDPDGIVKMDNTDQLVIVPMKNLAKLGVMNIFKKYRFEIYEMNHKIILIRKPFLNSSFRQTNNVRTAMLRSRPL